MWEKGFSVYDERADRALWPGMAAAVESWALLRAHIRYGERLRYG